MQPDSSPKGADERIRQAEELESFLYLAVHDLKAPLRTVDNLAQCIADDLESVAQAPASVPENLALLRSRVRRMARLLDDLQGYTQAGQAEGPAAEVDLGALIGEIVAELPAAVRGRVVLAPGLPRLSARKGALRRVLAQLVDNAFKHNDKADGRVEIAARTQGDRVLISVRDDGPGIAPRHQERVFKIFQTLKPRDASEGSGVGLALVAKLVRQNGGDVSLDSAEGKGSTFTVAWPSGAGAAP